MTVVAGSRLGPYEIVGLLGAGGMGEVYRARDARLGRDVAIKVLPAEFAAEPERLRRFEQEARAVAALDHPNILAIHDVGTHEGSPYLVTELLEGESLRERLSGGAMSVRKAVETAVQIAEGLAAAHEKGIVHRDLKPGNVFITRDGHVKILDFGIAKLAAPKSAEELAKETTVVEATEAGTVLGTVGYMSPEQLRGLSADQRSDIFSFGCVLYEMLSGQRAFAGLTAADTLSAILSKDPPSLAASGREVPAALAGIVTRCLEKRPEDRFTSARDVAFALQAVVEVAPRVVAVRREEPRPYPGLLAFTEADAEHFFGRDEEVAALWRKIPERKLLALIGPSGAGKTSFLRAGMIPHAPPAWRCLVATPGQAPFAGLARALAPAFAGDADAFQRLLDFHQPDTAVALISQWRERADHGLVILDQFEELFTLNGEDVQARFADLLGRIAALDGVHVLLSMRDDFLFGCHGPKPLAPIFDSITPLGPPTGDDLRRTVVEPAKAQGFTFEDHALVEEMLDAVEGERGALPLLAFAVARLWEERNREKKLLTREAYGRIGGVAGALAQHAEATLERIGEDKVGLVREIFRNLVTSQGTRTVLEAEELLSVFAEDQRTDARHVLGQLVDARLLTSFEVEASDGSHRHRVEIVHESLLQAWPRLVRWQAQDAEGALLRDQLRQAAHLWEEKGKPDDLLWTGTSFQEYQVWRSRYPGGLSDVEETFARAMVANAGHRRRVRRLVVAAVITVLAAGLTVVGSFWRRSVREARRAEANALLALGRAELDRYPTAAVAYARKSLEVADTPEGRRFVVDALWRSPTARFLPLGNKSIWTADFSPDGRWLAGYPLQGGLVLVPNDGGPVRLLPGPSQTALPNSARFTPDGEAILTMTVEEGYARMWSVPDGQEIRRFDPQPPEGYAPPVPLTVASASRQRWTLPQGNFFLWLWPDERLRASAGVPFGIWPFDGGPPTLVGSLPGSTGLRVNVDPDGATIVVLRGRRLFVRPLVAGGEVVETPVATLDDPDLELRYPLGLPGDQVGLVVVKDGVHRLLVWPIGTGAASEPRVFSMPNPWQYGPCFDPAGSRMAWTSREEKSTRVWELSGPPEAAPTFLRTPNFSPERAAFARTGDWLVVPHGEMLSFWSLAQPQARVLAGHRQDVNRLVFTRDSRDLVSCGTDDVRLWPLGPGRGKERRITRDYRGWCMDAALAPDGERLVLVGSEGAYLAPSFDGRGRWVAGGGAEGTPESLEWPILLQAAAWDASGRTVAVASSYALAPGNATFVLDLEAETERRLPLAPAGETGETYDWGVVSLAFTPDGRLLAGGSGGLRWLDPDTGDSEWIWRLAKEESAAFAASTDGCRLVARTQRAGTKKMAPGGVVRVDLPSGAVLPLDSHGRAVTAVALDGAGRTLVTGDEEGAVRVGSWEGGEPHRLCCHAAPVDTISISPDGKWIASASGGEIRLWPMPDLSKPPLHTLPHSELMAKLRSLTNLQVVEDKAATTGYKLEVGPFPGWATTPEWNP